MNEVCTGYILSGQELCTILLMEYPAIQRVNIVSHLYSIAL